MWTIIESKAVSGLWTSGSSQNGPGWQLGETCHNQGLFLKRNQHSPHHGTVSSGDYFYYALLFLGITKSLNLLYEKVTELCHSDPTEKTSHTVGGELTAFRTPPPTGESSAVRKARAINGRRDTQAGGTQAGLGLQDTGLLGWAVSWPKNARQRLFPPTLACPHSQVSPQHGGPRALLPGPAPPSASW